MDKKKTITDFEIISESQENKLVGGFSSTFNVENNIDMVSAKNNCSGGNCRSGCGTGQNIQCNLVAHCGVEVTSY